VASKASVWRLQLVEAQISVSSHFVVVVVVLVVVVVVISVFQPNSTMTECQVALDKLRGNSSLQLEIQSLLSQISLYVTQFNACSRQCVHVSFRRNKL